jgi:hypothetical protein
MKKKLIISIALALVIVAVLAVCLSGCDSNNKEPAVVLEEYVGNGYSEIYAKLPYAVSGWIHVDSYRIYDNGVIVIETNLATSYGEAQKRKFVTDISQVTFQCTNNGLLI